MDFSPLNTNVAVSFALFMKLQQENCVGNEWNQPYLHTEFKILHGGEADPVLWQGKCKLDI